MSYVTVHLLREPGDRDKTTPARAFGTIPCSWSPPAKGWICAWRRRREIRPNTKIKVKIAAPGAGEGTRLTLAAVDEGICQLSGYTGLTRWGSFLRQKTTGCRQL